MCGISGFVHDDRTRIASAIKLRAMSSTLLHRGPDGHGIYTKDNLALGHQRLAIIDLTSGSQPMSNRDNTIVITFNGEIYNYIELREELKGLGYHFDTTSDTEVLMCAYEHWGLNLHAHLNGMWAFALWDERKHQLLLSRDRIGEKPLYYAESDRTIIFGSECKAILAYGLRREADLSLLELYLTLGYIPAPFTFFKGIKKLKPGHFIVVSSGVYQTHKFWDLPDGDEAAFRTCQREIDEQFVHLLADSVKIRMRSDVPFGAFLSGGLDSASIVALMASNQNFPIETFTIGFPEKEFDERLLAAQVAERFGTSHHEFEVMPGALEESVREVVRTFDEPFGDSSALPVRYVSRCARGSVKMVLTGDGGDEVLSGYNAYQTERLCTWCGNIPRFVTKAALAGLKLTAAVASSRGRREIAHLRSAVAAVLSPFNESLLRRATWANDFTINKIIAVTGASTISPIEFLDDLLRGCRWQDRFYRLMFYNLKLTLPEDMLTKVDRMSMAHSLEARLPYLDHRLVEHMVTVDKSIKMPWLRRKAVLRRTIAKRLPAPLLRARKKGFVVPLREWLKDTRVLASVQRSLVDAPFLDQESSATFLSRTTESRRTMEILFGCY